MINNRYIKKLRIVNFQSHEDTTLLLDKGVNVIIGPSDMGKSAVLRALKLLFYNEPRGDYYVRHGATNAMVEVTYSDDTIIRRLRNKSQNIYEIEKNGIINKYQGYGNGIPREIIEITGMEKFDLSENNKFTVNFQSQLDNIFLLMDSPTNKAKAIGSISGVNIIDEATRRAHLLKRNATNKIKELHDEIVKTKELLEEYKDIDKDKIRLNALRDLLEKIEYKNEKLQRLKRFNINKQMIENKYIEINNELLLYKNINYNIQKLKDIIHLNQRYSSLKRLLNAYSNAKSDYSNNQNTVEKLKVIQDLNSVINKLTEKNNKAIKLRESFLKYKKTYECLETAYETISMTKNVSKAEELINNADKILERGQQLSNLYRRYLYIKNEESQLDLNLINNYVSNAIFKFHNININIENLKNLQDYKVRLNKLQENSLCSKDELYQINKNLRKYLAEFIKEIENNKICPLCNGEITSEHIDEIKKEYIYEL